MVWIIHMSMTHVVRRIVRCHVTHMNESWHTYIFITSHLYMSHATHMNDMLHCKFSRSISLAPFLSLSSSLSPFLSLSLPPVLSLSFPSSFSFLHTLPSHPLLPSLQPRGDEAHSRQTCGQHTTNAVPFWSALRPWFFYFFWPIEYCGYAWGKRLFFSLRISAVCTCALV